MSHAADEGGVSVDAVQITTDSVSLEREPEFRDEGVVLTYRLRTDAGDPEVVTVSDVVPAPLPTESAGFHPDNEPVEWEIEDRTLDFETVVPRQGERIIVFGVALADAVPSDVVFSEPTIESVEPASDRDDLDAALPDVGTPDRAGAIAQVLEGNDDASADSDEVSGPASSSEIEAALATVSDDEEADATGGEGDDDEDEEVTIDLSDPAETSTAPGGGTTDAESAADTESTADAESTASAAGPAPESGLVDALVEELESDRVTDDQREALAEALDLEPSNSLDVRLSHVQSRMDDFAAYADALEEIIDEHGTADAFMNEVRETVESMEAEVAAVDDRLDDVVERLDELEAEASTRDEQVEQVVSDLEDFEGSLRDRDRVLAGVDRDLQQVRDSVAEREELLSMLEDEVDDLAAVSDDLAALEEAADDRDEALDSLQDDISSLEQEVEEVAAMRETLVSALTNPEQDVGDVDAEDDA